MKKLLMVATAAFFFAACDQAGQNSHGDGHDNHGEATPGNRPGESIHDH